MKNLRFLLSAILLFFLVSIASAQTLLPEPLEELRKEGFEALFNMSYPAARAKFEQMIAADPKHPAGYVYLANTIWLGHLASLRRLQTGLYNRNNSFFTKQEDAIDPKVDKEFRGNIDKGIDLAEAKLRSNNKDIEALYYLGVAKNITAGYEATVKRSFLAAVRNGSKGTELHRKVLKQDPKFIDAKLSIGMYNYVVGSLPWGMKLLMLLSGVHGSKKDGLQMLEQVAKEGNYARDEAATLLVMLYDRERRYEDSERILRQQSEKYPNNLFYRLQLASTLAELKRFRQSFTIFEEMLNEPVGMDYMPDLIHYQYADALSMEGSWEKACAHFLDAAASPKAPDGLVTLAHLQTGKSLDAMGKRDEAKAEYQLVLKRKDLMDLHAQAEKYLKKPFTR